MSEPSSTRRLLRSVPYLLFFVSYWATDALFVPYLGLYFEMRGLNSVQIGMLNSLFFVVTVVSALTIGYIADSTRKPRLTICICFCCIILVILYMSKATSLVHLAAAYAMYGYFVVSCSDLAEKLLMEQLAEDTRFFGLFRVGGPLGYSGGAILAGYLISRAGNAALFPVCIVFAALCVAMALLMQESRTARQPRKRGQRVPLRQLFTNWQSGYLYGTMVLWGFSEGGALAYLAVYMSDRGFSTEYTSALITIAMVGQTCIYFLMPLIQPRVHPKTLVMLGFITFSGRILSLALIGTPYFSFFPVAVLHFIGGTAQALILTPITLMIGRNFSPEVSSTAQTLKTVASKGIGSSTGAFLYGWLYSVIPARSVMLLFTVLIFAFGVLSRLGGMWVDERQRTRFLEHEV